MDAAAVTCVTLICAMRATILVGFWGPIVVDCRILVAGTKQNRGQSPAAM
jgi:hypothetical protein